MTSDKKIQANRLNAKNSSGPGNTSRTKYNATTHGFRGRRVLITGEDPKAYNRMFQQLVSDFKPQGFYENYLVQRIADRMWEIERAVSLKSQITESGEFRDDQQDELAKMTRYETQLEKSLMRFQRELERLQKTDIREAVALAAPARIDAPVFPFHLSQGEAACNGLTRLAKLRLLRNEPIQDAVGRYIFSKADRQLATEDESPSSK